VLQQHFYLLSSLLILTTNLAFTLIASPLIQFIGYKFTSEERGTTSLAIFLVTLLNSGVMPLMLQANFSADYKGSLVDWLFSSGGRNSDFGPSWYPDIASQLHLTLLLMAF